MPGYQGTTMHSDAKHEGDALLTGFVRHSQVSEWRNASYELIGEMSWDEDYSFTQGGAAYANNGDYGNIYFILDGDETKLHLLGKKGTSGAKIDVYLNGSLDTQGIDLYAAAPEEYEAVITLNTACVVGMNIVKLKVNTKNASSSDYTVQIREAVMY